MNASATVGWDPLWSNRQGLSDHAALYITILPKVFQKVSDSAIPSHVAKSDCFRVEVERLLALPSPCLSAETELREQLDFIKCVFRRASAKSIDEISTKENKNSLEKLLIW